METTIVVGLFPLLLVYNLLTVGLYPMKANINHHY